VRKGTDCEDGLLVGEGRDVGIELLARLGLDDHVEKRLRPSDNAGWQISNAHFVRNIGVSIGMVWSWEEIMWAALLVFAGFTATRAR